MLRIVQAIRDMSAFFGCTGLTGIAAYHAPFSRHLIVGICIR